MPHANLENVMNSLQRKRKLFSLNNILRNPYKNRTLALTVFWKSVLFRVTQLNGSSFLLEAWFVVTSKTWYIMLQDTLHSRKIQLLVEKPVHHISSGQCLVYVQASEVLISWNFCSVLSFQSPKVYVREQLSLIFSVPQGRESNEAVKHPVKILTVSMQLYPIFLRG